MPPSSESSLASREHYENAGSLMAQYDLLELAVAGVAHAFRIDDRETGDTIDWQLDFSGAVTESSSGHIDGDRVFTIVTEVDDLKAAQAEIRDQLDKLMQLRDQTEFDNRQEK